MRKIERFTRRTAVVCLVAAVVATVFFHSALAEKENGGPRVKEFKVITYNVCGLPDFITYDRGLAPTRKRFAAIGDRLKPYDIIGLQEAFIPDRGIIEKKLADRYVVHGTDVGSVRMTGSGVYFFSRWPILKSHFEKWGHTGGADALSHKGFVAAQTQVDSELTMDVYNLHGQTKWDEMKLKNYEQLARFMDWFSIGQGRPILLIGDFNCHLDDEVCGFVRDRMSMTLAWPGQEHVDHIFYNENGSGWSISTESAGAAMEEKLDGRLLSDHTAVEATVRLRKEGN